MDAGFFKLANWIVIINILINVVKWETAINSAELEIIHSEQYSLPQ